jgi:hypothetical protein
LGSGVKEREKAHRHVHQSWNSDGNIDSDGHLLVDGVEDHHKAAEKQKYGEVKECWSCQDCKA